MKTFKVLFRGWESSGSETLNHANKTEMEFNNDCREVVNKIVLESDDSHLSNEEVFSLMINILVSDYGYKKYRVDATFKLPGDEGTYVNNDFEYISLIVPKETLEKFSKKVLKCLKEERSGEYYSAYKLKIERALSKLK